MPLSILERELYTIAEAARLLDLAPWKLKRWLDGFTTHGTFYGPVIRLEQTENENVTWAEFVEAGFLREYRAKNVSLQHLREIVGLIRAKTGVPYPLAHYKPLVASRKLVLGLDFADLRNETATLAELRGDSWQLLWGKAVDLFLTKVEFEDDAARRIHPLGKDSPVALDPLLAFGIPQVNGIRTEVIAEAFLTNETPEQIAKSYAIPVDLVHEALRWELNRRQEAA